MALKIYDNFFIKNKENNMNVENVEVTEQEMEKEPIYFAPKRVSLVSDIAGIFSWIILVGFIAYFVVELVYLQSQMTAGNLVLSTVIKEPSFISYLFANLVIPLLTGLGLFAILQAVAAGLNVLLEMDFNAHEAAGKPKA
jgi:hypothetical protein